MRSSTKRVDSRSIIRLGAELWRNGHESIEFMIPKSLSLATVLTIGSKLPRLNHRGKPLVIDAMVVPTDLERVGTMVYAHYKR